MNDVDIWGYHPSTGHRRGTDLIGYRVEAVDGSIGKIDRHTEDVGSSYLVVDTGVWIFGRKVLLPAGTVERIDTAERKVHLDRTKDQIERAPAYDEGERVGDPEYLERFGLYYGKPHM
ncbi:PRC-barrel domain containing protein [Streptomyces sp. ms191]|uniref:PRC-barrel domain-containing protein n=1 Tax=Streptomyces sp. ms191 TaxID=1827978 RepID=UPI0011CD4C6D|nr:PRC-barrel domain-containing protein [Streptomyces sp. ms191]TXS16736.1 PRC-barrel domain containing protein [Streptomyces sp. ms191]